MLKIENLCFRYSRYSTPVLNGIDLELADGEIGILLGKNGSGKTTLFKNILGIDSPEKGSILFDGIGESVSAMSSSRLPLSAETGME